MAPTLAVLLPLMLLLSQWQATSATDPFFIIKGNTKDEAMSASSELISLATKAAADGNDKEPCPESLLSSFEAYKTYFSKTYDNPAEEMNACRNFGASLRDAAKINMDGTIPFWQSINKYSDKTFQQLTNTMLMPPRDPSKIVIAANQPRLAYNVSAAVPSAYDHRNNNVVSPVKDQGACGSCWAFSGIGVIESAYMIKYGGSYRFSDSQIVQCLSGSSGYYSQGCNGGWADEPITYASKFSILQEAAYPYANGGGSTGSCSTTKLTSTPESKKVRLSSGALYVSPKSYTALMAAVYRAPTTVYFTVVNDFYGYSGGIYQGSTCGTYTNHAMVLVGYNEPGGYWIIKNSWGTGWGVNGYVNVRMIKSDSSSGVCGMYDETYASPLEFSSTITDGATPSPPPSPSPKPPPLPPPSPPPSNKPPRPPGGQRNCRNRGNTRKYCYVWARKYKYCSTTSVYYDWMAYYCARACKCPQFTPTK